MTQVGVQNFEPLPESFIFLSYFNTFEYDIPPPAAWLKRK